ncbi:MAG: hypothetical protein KGJ79_03280 [Alphaproteobacteria bacterium]|nr:hypothetical protein [Alphaproteobacteria bacterium]
MGADHRQISARTLASGLLCIFRTKVVVFIAVLVLIVGIAHAGGRIPDAGTGNVEPMLRYSFSNQVFPAASFSNITHLGTKERETQIRLIGEYGLGSGFSLDYDLRYAFLYRSKTKNGVAVVNTYSGLQDQRIGLNYGLAQSDDFSDTIGLGVVLPGNSIAKSPGVGTGHWALEPIYRIAFKPGFWHLSGDFDIGSRVFLDGGAAQFRTHLEIGAPIFNRVHLSGKLFFVRSARMNGYNDLRDSVERYDLLRLGIEAKFHLTDSVEPILAYETGIAGMGGHASQRFTLGMKISF